MSLMIACNNIQNARGQLNFFKNLSLALEQIAPFKWKDENHASQFGLAIKLNNKGNSRKKKSLYFFKKRTQNATNIKDILDNLENIIKKIGGNSPINFICVEITRGGKWEPPPYFYKDIVVFPVGSIGLNWAKRNYFATSSLGKKAMAVTSAHPNTNSGLLFAAAIKIAIEKYDGNILSAGKYFLSDVKTLHCSLVFSKNDDWYLFLRSRHNENGFILKKQSRWTYCSEKINCKFSKIENIMVL